MQIGTWFLTLHFAFRPQSPGQGSWHFLLIHALSVGQSALIIHSGLQFGGEPIIPGRHVHWHLSPTFLGGFVFGPQGFGLQGSSSMTGSIAINTKSKLQNITCTFMNTHVMVSVYMLWKGLQYSPHYMCRWEYGSELYNWHSLHMFLDMGQCSEVVDMLCLMDNPSWQHTLVCRQHMDFQSSQEYIDRRQLYFSHCKLHLIHREMESMDW